MKNVNKFMLMAIFGLAVNVFFVTRRKYEKR